jgi:hypothetical protein
MKSNFQFEFNRKNVIFYLSIIVTASFVLRLCLIPYELPLTFDALLYFWYGNDISILGKLPVDYTLANNGWPIFLSIFFNGLESNNFLDYMILQRVLSVILSCLTIIPVYFLCRKFFNINFSIIGALIFAFEPHLILNSILGITESLFILLTTSAIVAILNSKIRMSYVAFILASLAVLVRSEGMILFLPLSILFLITNRKNKKTLLHYPILSIIFIIILIPTALHNLEINDNDGFLSRVVSETSQINIIEKEITNQSSQLDLIDRIEKFIKMFGWSLIPIFIMFIPFGLFHIIKSHKFDDFIIITLLGTMMIPVIYALSFLPDPRYSYFVFPIFIVVSLFTIKSIHDKIINKNLILIIIITGILVSSIIFIEFKKIDVSDETEAFELSGHIVESTKVINQHIPNSGYIPIIGLEKFEKFPMLRETFEQKLGMEYCVDVHTCSLIILVNSDKIEDFIDYGKTNGLTHIIIYKNDLEKKKFMKDIFNNEENFPYLVKIFDSKKEYFFHHLKIFEINYQKYDNMR